MYSRPDNDICPSLLSSKRCLKSMKIVIFLHYVQYKRVYFKQLDRTFISNISYFLQIIVCFVVIIWMTVLSILFGNFLWKHISRNRLKTCSTLMSFFLKDEQLFKSMCRLIHCLHHKFCNCRARNRWYNLRENGNTHQPIVDKLKRTRYGYLVRNLVRQFNSIQFSSIALCFRQKLGLNVYLIFILFIVSILLAVVVMVFAFELLRFFCTVTRRLINLS